MAKAMANREMVERAVTKIELVYVPKGVTLELTHNEARTLAEILASVGGDPEKTARRYAAAISTELSREGYRFTRRPPGPRGNFFIHGSIDFLADLPEAEGTECVG